MMNRYATAMGAVVFIIAAGVFWLTFEKSIIYSPTDETAIASAPPDSVRPSTHVLISQPVGDPRRLIIPSIGIDANIQRTGISAKGNMGVPTNFTDVAWYAYGPRPGELGDAVIDGHVDNGLSLPGVFKHLDNIATGTELYVETDTGQYARFIVSNISEYNYLNVPVQTIFTRSGPATLKLITCTGDWVQGGDTYDQRLVVTATLDTIIQPQTENQGE